MFSNFVQTSQFWIKKWEYRKAGCVFLMVIWFKFRMGPYREDDHREDAPHFISDFWTKNLTDAPKLYSPPSCPVPTSHQMTITKMYPTLTDMG